MNSLVSLFSNFISVFSMLHCNWCIAGPAPYQGVRGADVVETRYTSYYVTALTSARGANGLRSGRASWEMPTPTCAERLRIGDDR